MSSNQRPKSSISENMSNTFDLKKNLISYLKQWKWFAVSIVIFVGFAFFYLRYAIPEYNAYAKIVLNTEGSSSPGEALKELNNFSESDKKSTDDEIEVLRSRSVISGVIKKLSLNIQYSLQGMVGETQLFQKSPIATNFSVSDSIIENSKLVFKTSTLSLT